MTILAFNGKYVVADSLVGHEVKDKSIQTDVDRGFNYDTHNKIIPLKQDWDYGPANNGNKFVISAFMVCGNLLEANRVIMDMYRSIDLGWSILRHREHASLIFGSDVNCTIIGIGVSTTPEGQQFPDTTVIFSNDGQGLHNWNLWECRTANSGMAIAGWWTGVVDHYTNDKIFRKPEEIVMAMKIIAPGQCGGRILKYDPVTRKMSYVKDPSVKRMTEIFSKMREVEARTIIERYTDIENKLKQLGE